jgi:hypothetical protein
MFKIILIPLIFVLSLETAFAAKMATCQGKYGDSFPFCCIDFTNAANPKDCPAHDLKCWQFSSEVTCDYAAKATRGVISSTCTLTTPVNGHQSILEAYCQKSKDNPSGYALKLEK